MEVKMLARPEIKTKEHVLLWLAGKPADETYDWNKAGECACGQYWGENVDRLFPHKWGQDLAMDWFNMIAMDCKTFGELYQKVCADAL
jgi:hypothetical protein